MRRLVWWKDCCYAVMRLSLWKNPAWGAVWAGMGPGLPRNGAGSPENLQSFVGST